MPSADVRLSFSKIVSVGRKKERLLPRNRDGEKEGGMTGVLWLDERMYCIDKIRIRPTDQGETSWLRRSLFLS
jgi:hypothetical protein